MQQRCFVGLVFVALAFALATASPAATPTPQPEGTLTVAVENHWRAVPHFKRLVFLKVPEPATRMAMLRAESVDVIETGGEYAEELKKLGVRTLVMPNTAWVWVILGRQWPTQPTYDPTVPWALTDPERARKVRLALNLAVDKQAIIQRVLGGLGTPAGTVNFYPTVPWATEALVQPYPYDAAKAKALLVEAGYPNGFEVTMNLTAWPGRGFLPDVGEAVATYWEKVGLKVKRRPVDRAIFSYRDRQAEPSFRPPADFSGLCRRKCPGVEQPNAFTRTAIGSL